MIGVEHKRMRHPKLDTEITVPASAVPHHRAAGWLLVEDEPKPEVTAPTETVQERPPRRRRAVERTGEEGEN